MRAERRFKRCGRCGSTHIRINRIDGAYVCACGVCGKRSEPQATMREAYRCWQYSIATEAD